MFFKRGIDQRRYNEPRHDEVAAVFVGDDGAPPFQRDIVVELYQGLMDNLHSQAAQQNLQPGRMVILPSSFHGSPRAMKQNYQNALAIIAKFGEPDLFLTFTCNPKSQEITENLPPGIRAETWWHEFLRDIYKNSLPTSDKDMFLENLWPWCM